MRRIVTLAVALVLLAAPAFAAEQPRCPLPLHQCLEQFGRMRERPWLGVMIERDSVTQVRVIRAVTPGGPAERAGLRVGDTLEQIGGVDPNEWFTGRAGWKDAPTTSMAVRREGRKQVVQLPNQAIPEALLARIVGEHMLEGHLAYAHTGEDDEGPERR